MLSFSNYVMLAEAKVDDIAAKYPDHEEAIRAYNKADPTPTKKFLPWLVRQHMKGHVTPDDVRLEPTLHNFDKFAHKLPSKDHHSYTFNELAHKIGEHIKDDVEKKSSERATERVFDSPENNITAQHIKTKEAAQKMYGGGASRKGTKGCETGTSWCVAARSDTNYYGHYGPLYTIHAPHDPDAPYAVHPLPGGKTIITTRKNDGDRPADSVLHKKPHLADAVAAIEKHSKANIGEMLKSKEPLIVRRAILSHPDLTSEQLHSLIKHPDTGVRRVAVEHSNTTSEHLKAAASDQDKIVRSNVASHRLADDSVLEKLANDNESWVRERAFKNPNMSSALREKLLADTNNPEARKAKASHPDTSHEDIEAALQDPDVTVRHAATTNPNFTPKHINLALQDRKELVRQYAIKHKNASSENLDRALESTQPVDVRAEAAGHPNATPAHIDLAMSDEWPRVRSVAAGNPNSSAENISKAVKGGYIGALDLPNANDEHIKEALSNDSKYMRQHAVKHPRTTLEQVKTAFHNDEDGHVRADALNRILREDPDNAEKYIQAGVKDKHQAPRGVAISHKSVDANQLTNLIKNEDHGHVLSNAITNPNLTTEHMKAILHHPHAYQWTKEAMARHKKADASVIHSALDVTGKNEYGDTVANVRKSALRNKNVQPEHLDRGIEDAEKGVRMVVAKSKKATPAHLTKAMQDPLPSVRWTAVANPNATDEHIETGLKDKVAKVREAAQAVKAARAAKN